MFTEEQLAEILEICHKATEGPWETAGRNSEYIINKNNFNVCLTRRSQDAQFIALARTAFPWLAEDYRKLLAVAEAARVVCEELEGHGLYAISRLWEALTIAGYGGEE